MERIELDLPKVRLEMARKQMNVTTLAAAYGVSRARMSVILNQRTVTYPALGRLAAALGTDAAKICGKEQESI